MSASKLFPFILYPSSICSFSPGCPFTSLSLVTHILPSVYFQPCLDRTLGLSQLENGAEAKYQNPIHKTFLYSISSPWWSSPLLPLGFSLRICGFSAPITPDSWHLIEKPVVESALLINHEQQCPWHLSTSKLLHDIRIRTLVLTRGDGL